MSNIAKMVKGRATLTMADK